MGETEEIIDDDNKTQQINENKIHNTNINAVYHAVYVPPTDIKENTEDSVHVYTDKKEALTVIKSFRNGRLKTFKSLSEAEKFAKHGYQQEDNANKIPKIQINSINAEEKSSSFKAPKPQELVGFRKIIESGDVACVVRMAWENPRYLISSGDTPAILQEGCRFNALHVASFKCSNDVKMSETILEIVSDPKFVELLYGKGDKETCNTTAKIWLDLYLNTPDKGLNETPLHFAAKFGRKEVVKLLLSYPQCLKTVRNKYNQTPLQVVCSRKGQEDENLAKEIMMLFEEQYYVPVLRAEDNSLQPMIGQPFSPSSSPPRNNIDPLSPRLEVKAIAGPMTKPQAVEFRRIWKTPPRIPRTPNKNDSANNADTSFSFTSPRAPRDLGLRLQDTEKGLESAGRELAEEYHVPWKEFWPFLNNFTDLRCTEGLSALEQHLKQRSSAIIIKKKQETAGGGGGNSSRRRLVKETGDDNEEAAFSIALHEESDYMDVLIRQLEMCSLDRRTNSKSLDSDIDETFETPPETPIELSDTESDNDNDYSLAEEDAFVVNNIFIDGELPGKTDLAVLNAIPDIIHAELYPYIYRWKHEVILAKRRNHILSSTPRRRLLLTPEK